MSEADAGFGTGVYPDQLHGLAVALRQAQFDHAPNDVALDDLTARDLAAAGGVLTATVYRGATLICYVGVTAYGAFVSSQTWEGAVDGARKLAQREDRMMFGHQSG